MEQGVSRTDSWKLFEGIVFTTKQVVGIFDKKADYIDITCRSQQNVLDLYEKLSIEKRISNIRLFESDKITVAAHWVPTPFPIDTLKQYLETRHGSVLQHVSKVDKMGLEMGVHHFEMRKDDLNENFLGSYIYISGQKFLIRYKSQIETCHICNKPGNKGVQCDEKFDKLWPKLSDGMPKRKIRTYAKIPEKSSKLQKENQENEIVQCTFETNALTFDDIKQNEEHVHVAFTENTHDSSSNEKNCDWFEQVNVEENALGSNKTTKENRKRHRPIDNDNDNGTHSISKCNKNQQRLVKCTNCDQSNRLPDLTKKVKCVIIHCNFFVMHCECKKVMFEAFEGVAFIDCSCGFKFLKQQQYA